MSSLIEKKEPFKLFLCYNLTIDQPVEIKNNPISKLIKFDEIEELSNRPNFLKYIYFHKKMIHDILYDKEEIIYIKDINDNDLCSYIYLDFLIDANPNVVNYKYPFELIHKINNIQTKEDKKNNIKVILLAKIILNLIQNFEQIDDSDYNTTKNKENLNNIKKYNIDIINNKKNLFNEFEPYKNKNDITKMKLEEFYCFIINNLIIKDKINETDETNKIIKILEFESFNITRNILDKLKNFLNEEKEYIKKYKINKFEDIFDKKKIIFYYVLLNYIIKNNIYIYEIPFLDKTRKNILKYLKKDIEKLNEFIKKDKDNKHKIIFILQFFTNNFKYYSNLCIKKLKEKMDRTLNLNSSNIVVSSSNNQNSQSINNNYDIENSSTNSFFGDSYKVEKLKSGKSLNIIDEPQKDEYTILKEKYSNEKIFNILDNSFFTFHTNRKGSSPLIIYDEIIFQNNERITIDEVKRLTSNNEIIMNNYRKFLSILEEIKNKIEKEFNFKFKITVTLNFKTISVNNSLFNIKCIYNLKIQNESGTHEYKDEHIFKNRLSSGFLFLKNEINNDIYSDLNYEE